MDFPGGGRDAEPTPVAPEEHLYRRMLVPRGWYRPDKPKRIPNVAFMPRPWRSPERPGDEDGISVDQATMTSIETASTRPDTGERIILIDIVSRHVFDLGLDVVPKPLPENNAHAVVPELNSIDARDADKRAQIQEWALALRECATIVYDPPSK